MTFFMEEEKSKEALVRSLGIFELRGLARELGVQSPTTKKRDELIEKILEIVSNGEEPVAQGKRKGRPYKKLSSIQQIASSVTASWVDDNVKPTFESVMCFAQTLPNFDQILGESKRFCGYAREIDNMISFVDYTKQARVYIKNDVEFASKITNGDFVEVDALSLSGKGNYLAEKIININDVDASSYEPYCVENGEILIGKEKISLDDHEIILGRRNAFCMKEDLYEGEFLDEAISYCKSKNINLLVLALNTSYENMILLKGAQCKKFVSVSGTDARQNLDLLIDCINYAGNLLERGEKVLLFACDLVHSLKSVEGCFDEEDKTMRDSMDIIVQKIMAIAKLYENGVSATTLIGYYNLDLKNDNFVDKIFKICKNCE